MKSPVLWPFLILGTFASVVLAQDAEVKRPLQPTDDSVQHTSDAQQLKSPPRPEMQRLVSTFEGAWSVREEYEPTSQAPRGSEGEGQQLWRPGPAGLTLIEEYRSETPAGKVFGLSVTWWDEMAQAYRALWCVNTNPGGCTMMASLAKWQGSEFVLGDEFEMSGQKFTFKEVVSEITPNSFTQTLYQGPAGGELKVYDDPGHQSDRAVLVRLQRDRLDLAVVGREDERPAHHLRRRALALRQPQREALESAVQFRPRGVVVGFENVGQI